MIETKYIASGADKDGSTWYLYMIVIKVGVTHFITMLKRELYLAVSKTQYKFFKTQKGAEAWLGRMGAEL